MDYLPGNFSSYYGGVVGGVVDVKSRNPKTDGFHGVLEVNAYNANVVLETPITDISDLATRMTPAERLAAIAALVTWLGICDGNMQEGSFRCDANVSVRLKGVAELGTKAEVKNLNSFKFLRLALDHEIARQVAVLESGGGWIAHWMDRMDEFLESYGWATPELSLTPREYFQRQCWISFDPDEAMLAMTASGYLSPAIAVCLILTAASAAQVSFIGIAAAEHSRRDDLIRQRLEGNGTGGA